MPDLDPFSEYAGADDRMRTLIERMETRRFIRSLIQDGLQIISTLIGAGIAVYGLYLAATLIDGGSGAEMVGGAFIGGADLFAISKVFVNQRAANQGSIEPPRR